MTSAAKLYFWRSRAGTDRSSEQASAAAAEPSLDSSHRRSRHRHGHGSRFHQREGSDQLPRSHSGLGQLHGSRSFCHRASQTEHDSVRSDRRNSTDFENSNRNIDEVTVRVASWLRLVRNNQLPESVLRARERLVERLRGASLAGTRETTATSEVSVDESATNHEFNDFADGGGETQRNIFSSNPQFVNPDVNEIKKQPSSVSWDALCTLHLEVFKNTEETADTRAPADCCICLESFHDEDSVVRLDCRHRFHPMCLEPWVRTCDDCPYCRANITC